MNMLPALWALGIGGLWAFAQDAAPAAGPAGLVPNADAVAWGGAGLSTVIAVLVTLDRFGFLKRPSEKIDPAAPAAPAASGLTHADLMTEIKQVAARLDSTMGRLENVEDTLERIDERSREQPVAIARLEGKIGSWENRLDRIEDLLLGKGPPKMRNTG